jgi:hypothetical protein
MAPMTIAAIVPELNFSAAIEATEPGEEMVVIVEVDLASVALLNNVPPVPPDVLDGEYSPPDSDPESVAVFEPDPVFSA